MRNKLVGAAVLGVLVLMVAYVGFEWTIIRIYVYDCESLMLRYKGPLIFGKRDPAKTVIGPRKGKSAAWQNCVVPADIFIARSGGNGKSSPMS